MLFSLVQRLAEVPEDEEGGEVDEDNGGEEDFIPAQR